MIDFMRRNEIVCMVLGVIGVAGIVLAVSMCPGILRCLPRKKRRHFKQASIDQTVRRLLKKKWIRREITEIGIRLALTDKGYAEFLEWEFRRRKKQQKWDGRWRLLVFDIAEKRRNIRDQVRRELQRLGFRRLQDSVWAYPFPCEDILKLLQIKFTVRHEAVVLEVKRIYPDAPLRALFGLPKISK